MANPWEIADPVDGGQKLSNDILWHIGKTVLDDIRDIYSLALVNRETWVTLQTELYQQEIQYAQKEETSENPSGIAFIDKAPLDRMPALHWYLSRNMVSHAERFIQLAHEIWPGYINTKDPHYRAPIHLAAMHNIIPIMKVLVLSPECEANAVSYQQPPGVLVTSLRLLHPDFYDTSLGWGFDALGIAIACGNNNAATDLVIYGEGIQADYWNNPSAVSHIHLAALKQSPDVVELLMRHKVDDCLRTDPHFQDGTAMHIAAALNDMRTLRVLKLEADLQDWRNSDSRPICRDKDGQGPLTWAASHDSAEACESLQQTRADEMTKPGKFNIYPIFHTAQNDTMFNTTKWLASEYLRQNADDAGGEAMACNSIFCQALYRAVSFQADSPQTIKFLVEQAVSLKDPCETNWFRTDHANHMFDARSNLLHHYVKLHRCDADVLKTMLHSKKCDEVVNNRDASGRTPIEYALYNEAVIVALFQAGARCFHLPVHMKRRIEEICTSRNIPLPRFQSDAYDITDQSILEPWKQD
ncbi:ankyrin repeat-containing domain protein [Xylariomycetidae sp. FL2044]|nr:ankyrin repeat-containing domain protein [Xylariomycetidae sp. FL2044]